MTTKRKNFDAEIERLRGEYEVALAEATAAEHEHEIERRRLAGQQALGELSPDEAQQKRASLDADLAAKRDKLAVLRDAIPAVEARAAEEVEAQRKGDIKRSRDALAKACQGRYSASKNLARALREVENSGAELFRHRALVDEAVALHRERLGDETFQWPERAVDEEWEASEEVVAVVTGGPITPVADAQRAAEELIRVRAEQERERVEWFIREPTRQRLQLLPEHLRESEEVLAAVADYDQKLAEQRELRKRREQERAGESVQV